MRQLVVAASVWAAFGVVALAGCASNDGAAPAASTAVAAKPTTGGWRLEGRAMATAADGRAVDAALAVMKAGGSAVDAAIAAHAVLGLVEPQSSGLGGGGYMVVYDRKSGKTTVYDGRETAPSTATPDLFLLDGKTMGYGAAIASGRSVGTPGVVALYKAAHEAHGILPWGKQFEAAIKLADEGFIVSPRMSNTLADRRISATPLRTNPATAAYFYPNGAPLKVGDVRKNPEYAATLRAIAKDGPPAFYTGAIAQDIVAAVHSGQVGGDLSLKDLASYKALVKPALCGTYASYRICSAPPSASGGVAMNETMGLYQRLSAADAAKSPEAKLKDFVLAEQLAYADRDHYVADPVAVSVPAADLLDPKYLDARAKTPFKPGDDPQPGDPGAVLRGKPIIDTWGRDATAPNPGTTHMSFVDYEGNAVSFTATVEAPFGSYRWTHGFVLNNQLTDFSHVGTVAGKPVANAPGPGKRPRSSMSPSIVFDEKGQLFMVTGSPGGNSIVGYVAKTLVAVLDWGRTAQEASAMPNIVARGRGVSVESVDEQGKAMAATLRGLGFVVRESAGEVSGLNIIVARADHYEGGADPRREGKAVEILRGKP